MSRTFSSMYRNNYSSDYVDTLKMKCSTTRAINNNPGSIGVAGPTGPTGPTGTAGFVQTGTNWGDYLYWNNTISNWAVGDTNITLGGFAGQVNQGTNAVAIGYQAGNNTQGINAVAIGHQAGYTNQGQYAVAIGYQAGQTNQANSSVAIGSNSVASLANQIVLGTSTETVYFPGTTTNGSLVTSADIYVQGARFGLGGGAVFNNIACGLAALSSNTTGQKNAAISCFYALASNTTGNSNVAVGNRCLQYNTTASFNVAVGDSCLAQNITGEKNVAVGGFNTLAANTTGSSNVAVGYNAFSSGATFTNSTALGALTVIGASNSTAIGYNAATTLANQIMLGTSSETVYCRGVPTTGSTPYASLVLSSGLQLQTAYSTTPTANMLGYSITRNGTTVNPFNTATATNLSGTGGISVPTGIWNVSWTASITCSTGGSFNVLQIVVGTTASNMSAGVLSFCGQYISFATENLIATNISSKSGCFTYTNTTASPIVLYINAQVSIITGTYTAVANAYLTRIG